tara:strand:+ start:877 stop:1317 length:441 start_codon:yes stop_codon:yes gene_type:complete
MRGGRFNRKGQPALYLALDSVTALIECSQGFSGRLSPITLCEYDVECENIADLRTTKDQKALSVDFEDLDCAWLTIQLAGKTAPSQKIANDMAAAGYDGILVPSFAPDAKKDSSNLILWNWGPKLPHKVEVYDPSGRLPKNQLSWD